MKIEKVSENQIRCTLTKADLADRHLKLSELAYGTEKAKSLFRDMMQQAANEFGFEADDIPLMIEAIPLSSECIILVITKVEDPDELDTRFSKFSPSAADQQSPGESESLKAEGADEVLDLFRRIKKEKQRAEQTEESDAAQSSNESIELTKFYLFTDLDIVISASHVLNDFYHGENSLYKNPSSGRYTLVVSKNAHSPEDFNRVCNVLSEYGKSEKQSNYSQAYFNEHFEMILSGDAIQTLSQL